MIVFIRLTPEEREVVREMFKCSNAFLSQALAYERNSKKAREIREFCVRMGDTRPTPALPEREGGGR